MTGKARSILSLFSGDSLFQASLVIEPCHLSCEIRLLPRVYKLIDASATSALLFICPFLPQSVLMECNVWSATFERDTSAFALHCGKKRWLWTLKVKNAEKDNHNDIDAQFVQRQSNLR